MIAAHAKTPPPEENLFLFFTFACTTYKVTVTCDGDNPCFHRASRTLLPMESPLALHISAHPLLNLTCRWPAVRKHSTTTGHRLPLMSWIYTTVPFFKGVEDSRRVTFALKINSKLHFTSGNKPSASCLLRCILRRYVEFVSFRTDE